MYRNNVGTSPHNSEKISKGLEQITFNSIRKTLPDSTIVQACKSIGYKYRERKITPIVTVLHMILAAIWPEESFAASWQVLWTSFTSRVNSNAGRSPSLGSVAKARYRLPIKLWKNLFEWVSQQSQELSHAFDEWKGHRVVLLDGTCVSMDNKPQLFEEFGRSTGYHGKCRYPLA